MSEQAKATEALCPICGDWRPILKSPEVSHDAGKYVKWHLSCTGCGKWLLSLREEVKE